MKKVLVSMALVGVILVGYTLKLHELVWPASEAQAHQACRQVCKLQFTDLAETGQDNPMGALVNMFAAGTCEAMDEGLEVLKDCRERLQAGGMTVATWRCVSVARSMADAKACDESLF